MLISFFETTEYERKEYIKALGNIPNVTLQFFSDVIQNIEVKDYIKSDILSVFVHSKIDKQIIDDCSNLRLISTRSTGMDHIDISYAQKKKIKVLNVPLYGENTVAEHTFALILTLSRKIQESLLKTKKGNFSTTDLMGFDLKDKTIGILGGGRIGLHVAKIAKSFGMNVLVYDIKQDLFLSELIGFTYMPFDDVLKNSDIISLHMPLNSSTKYIIRRETLEKMKYNTLLINTARGGLIRTDDLIDALNTGKLSGVGLDVLDGEQYLTEESIFANPSIPATDVIRQCKQLTDMPNAVLTPHNAYNSVEAVSRIITETVQNIQSVL